MEAERAEKNQLWEIRMPLLPDAPRPAPPNSTLQSYARFSQKSTLGEVDAGLDGSHIDPCIRIILEQARRRPKTPHAVASSIGARAKFGPCSLNGSRPARPSVR